MSSGHSLAHSTYSNLPEVAITPDPTTPSIRLLHVSTKLNQGALHTHVPCPNGCITHSRYMHASRLCRAGASGRGLSHAQEVLQRMQARVNVRNLCGGIFKHLRFGGLTHVLAMRAAGVICGARGKIARPWSGEHYPRH